MSAGTTKKPYRFNRAFRFGLATGCFRNGPMSLRFLKTGLCCASILMGIVCVLFLASPRAFNFTVCLGYGERLCASSQHTRGDISPNTSGSRSRLGLQTNAKVDSAVQPADPRSGFTQNKEMCVLPKLDPYDAEIKAFDRSVHKLVCSTEENWVYVKNGTFRLTEGAKNRQAEVWCDYTPVLRGDGDFAAVRYGKTIKNVSDGSPLVTDFFKVKCTDGNRKEYENAHMGVASIPQLHMRGHKTPLPTTAMGEYDVFILGFDSMSRMSWYRNLPKTTDFFAHKLGGVELEGHTIVGDGTTQALLTLLTGQMELELPTSRRGDPKAVVVDDYPWIWRDFQRAGYVTAYGEDQPHIGTFQYRLKGFRKQPTDHYMRTFYLASKPLYKRFPSYCMGSEARHNQFINYFRDMYHMYGAKRKFMFGFHSEYSHSDNNLMKMLDEDLTEFLRHLNDNGYLNHTILMLMADHGPRFSNARQTQQGKLEERLPYLGLYFPPGFNSAYPEKMEQLRHNRKRLTTNFDIHETLRDLIDASPTRASRSKGRGISLFKPIPESRTCDQAGIEPHWCACLQWEDVSHDLELKAATGKAVVDFLNNLMQMAGDLCETLSVHQVVGLSRFVPRKDVLKFKQSADRHGDKPDLSDKMTTKFEYIQVDLLTRPGLGRFESTIKHSLDTGAFSVTAKDISRTNKYGNASACLDYERLHLRSYCYCKQMRERPFPPGRVG